MIATSKDSIQRRVDTKLVAAWQAFHIYRRTSLQQRANFLRGIACEIMLLGNDLITVANNETNLPATRLRNERERTISQLNNYADACERGDWLEVSIDTADSARNPAKPDIRKMMVPIGPVIVFCASNFPFAFSTAGGDTASALATGCPVIVKAHSAHTQTSALMATAIFKAMEKSNMPAGIFAHIEGSSHSIGEALVNHRYTKAVGFTGSFQGGKALFNWANQRKEPIPVFAEMGSINPVFLLPGKLKEDPTSVAKNYAASITLGVGQFCTNPGLIIGLEGDDLQKFTAELGIAMGEVSPGKMLHDDIAKNYSANKALALSQHGVDVIISKAADDNSIQGSPALASVDAETFVNNPVLHQEVFGPYSLIVRCRNENEMLTVAQHLEGQLTATLMATDEDIRSNGILVEFIKNICGRLLMNGVPTGVEVCLSMQHGGPFPASTDSRFTSVGADAMKRFIRPLAFQNWSAELLPEELKNENTLGIWRTVNNKLNRLPL